MNTKSDKKVDKIIYPNGAGLNPKPKGCVIHDDPIYVLDRLKKTTYLLDYKGGQYKQLILNCQNESNIRECIELIEKLADWVLDDALPYLPELVVMGKHKVVSAKAKALNATWRRNYSREEGDGDVEEGIGRASKTTKKASK